MEILKYNNSLVITYKKQEYTVTVGDTFQRLTVTELVNYKDNGGTSRKGCVCKCVCGNTIGPSRLHMLFNGELISCGCYSSEIHSKQLKEKNFKHGEAIKDNRSKLYSLWVSMTDRARNANRPDSQYYALKGITVCDEWLDYVKFKEWAMDNSYQEGLSIERLDVDKGYNPTNCTFIELKDQNKNKSSSRIIEYNGVRKNMSTWCHELGISYTRLDSRLKSMSIGKALGFED